MPPTTPCPAESPPTGSEPLWGRAVADHHRGWVVVDVETSGFRPGQARVVSVAALALDAEGRPAGAVSSLCDAGVDPGPTHVHGLTAEMLDGQPRFADVAPALAELLRDRTLVAHNAAFDYAFLTAEAELADIELPVDEVMCTVELCRRLQLGCENLRLETLARHFAVPQLRPHDAADDAAVLAGVLTPSLRLAAQRDTWLPIRPVGRRRWPNGRTTHDELRPLKALASRTPCRYANPGRHVPGRPLVQGMRVALSAQVHRTHEELVERMMRAGLAYCDDVDGETSLVLGNDAAAEEGRARHARELGIPVMGDEEFLVAVDAVVGGRRVEHFVDPTLREDQYALF